MNINWYSQLGVMYSNDYDHSQALAYMEEALKYYGMAGKAGRENGFG